MDKVFISYRRKDAGYIASQIRDKAVKRFGRRYVVFDVDTVPPGIDFRDYIYEEVSKCNVLLAIIGDGWLEEIKRRAKDPKDFVRLEIELAIEQKIPVVPVLTGDAAIPEEEQLPETLRALCYRNATEVRSGRDLKAHVQRLVESLDVYVPLQAPVGSGPRARVAWIGFFTFGLIAVGCFLLVRLEVFGVVPLIIGLLTGVTAVGALMDVLVRLAKKMFK